MAKRLRSIPPVIPHYPPDNDRGAYAPQLWYGDEAVNAADGPWYDAPPGSIYVQGGTAAGALYSKVADTGTAGDWQALAASSGGTTGYNVRDYGATGDGTTDDAAAINAAISAAYAGGGYVYFPAGTYSLGSTLNLIDSTTAATGINRLVGAGVDRTILKLAASANCDIISHTNFATLTGGASRWGLYHTTIESLSIDGNRASNTSGYGIRLYGRGLIVRDVYIHDCSNDGLYTEHGGADDFTAWTGDVESFFVNVKCALNDGNGWTFKGDGDAQVVGFVAYSNGDWGWDVQQSVHATHVNTYLNTSGGIWVNGSGVLDGSNIAATTATGHGLLIDTGTGPSTLANLTAAGPIGIEIRSQNHVITGTIVNTTTAGLKFGTNGKALVAVSMTLNSGYWIDISGGGGGSTILVSANSGVGTLFNGTPGDLDMLCSVNIAPTSYSATSYLQLPGSRTFHSGGYTYTLPTVDAGTLVAQDSGGTLNAGLIVSNNSIYVLKDDTGWLGAITYHGTAANYPFLRLLRGRGTDAAKADVQVGDYLGGVNFLGHKDAGDRNSAQIRAVVSGVGTNIVNSALQFAVLKDNVDHAQLDLDSATGVTINEGGAAHIDTRIEGDTDDHLLFADASADKVGIGASTLEAKLHIDQSSLTGALPPLLLNQADVSEEMLELRTTVGEGNAIEAAGTKVLTPTHYIKATITGVGTVYIPCGTIATP